MTMRMLGVGLALLVGVGAAFPEDAATQPAAERRGAAADAKAEKLANGLVAWLGGWEAWEAVPYLRFEFQVLREGEVVVSRRHLWDRVGRQHRVEGVTGDGREFVVLTDLDRHRGRGYLDGELAQGEEAEKLVESGYALWVNDTYWLAMPFKVRDPGVTLDTPGSEVFQGAPVETFRVTFDGVGLTPKDVYWVLLDPETSAMKGWAFVLGGKEEPPTYVTWEDWREVGGVKLSGRRVVQGREQEIRFPVLEAPSSLPEGWFEGPGAGEATPAAP